MFRPSNPFSRPPSQDPRSGQTYLPPSVQRAMTEYEQTAKQGNEAAAGVTAPQVIAPSPQSPPPESGAVTPAQPGTAGAPASPAQPYDFITDPPAPPRQSLLFRLPGGGSRGTRIALGIGVLVIVIILISIAKGITSQAGNADAAVLLNVAQDQQEMIHVVNESITQPSLSNSSRNFSATLRLSMSESQSQIIQYLTNGGRKLTPAQLQLRISKTADDQLNAALTANTFDQAYRQVMQAQLSSYGRDIQKAYDQDKGPKARAILKDSYQQAQLLSAQLNSPTS
ncbi:MAG: hypothetical protein ACREJM_00315 [Candidatus Saccharimonadales bacterium]